MLHVWVRTTGSMDFCDSGITLDNYPSRGHIIGRALVEHEEYIEDYQLRDDRAAVQAHSYWAAEV